MSEERECYILSELEEDLFEASAAGPSSRNSCRVKAGNSCGSGTLVGKYNGGSLVLTNAHVAGSRVGTSATCEFDFGQGSVVRGGRIIMAAYSTRVTADWAILFIEGWQPIAPVFCTKVRPTSNDRFYTSGSPGCVWPLRHQTGFRLVSNNNAGFAVWNVPAIGGQSGSGVFNLDSNLVQLLLTWRTGNNQGAGQPLDFIYQQARTAIQTGALIGGALPEDAEMLSNVNEDVEEGFFAEASIRNLPIWFEDQPKPEPEPEPEPRPEPDCPPKEEEEEEEPDIDEPGPEVPKSEITNYLRRTRDDADELLGKLEKTGDNTPIINPSDSHGL